MRAAEEMYLPLFQCTKSSAPDAPFSLHTGRGVVQSKPHILRWNDHLGLLGLELLQVHLAIRARGVVAV